MKNKEIEELLNNLNKKIENYELDKKFGQLSVDSIYHLFPNEIQLLLSYIEQLENNKEKEYVLVGRMQLKTRDYIHQLEKEKRQLENNRDKVIEFIKEIISSTKGVLNDYSYNKEHNKQLIELLKEDVEMYKNTLNLLKGDSDE